MPITRTYTDGVLVSEEDDRTLAEAKAEATARLQQAASDAMLTFALPYETIRVRLSDAQTRLAATRSNKTADAVEF
jgi:hypothetical protein